MKAAVIGFLLLAVASVADISMYNLKIGDAQTALKKIDLEKVAEDGDIIKYTTKNGNDFSVTSQNGKIVFMENDWLQDLKATKPLYSDFEFGKTTLAMIRKAMGNNGFAYKEIQSMRQENDVIMFNCFEFDSPNHEVLVLICKLAITDDVKPENIADRAKLDAIIIADPKYLEEIWGKEKIFDPAYKKIKP